MIPYNSLIVRYSEIGLKGKNRRWFESRLAEDIKRNLSAQGITGFQVRLKRGRIYVEDLARPLSLDRVFGVHSFSPAVQIPKDYRRLREGVAGLTGEVQRAGSFRVSCQRLDKGFFKTSVEVEREMGAVLFEATTVPVKLKDPELNLQIEIGETHIYLFWDKIPGPRGLPYGTAGRLVSLISGGIDSPVATYLMMKRGVEPVLLHFKIGEDDYRKVIRLKERLEEYTGGRSLELVVIDRHTQFEGKFSDLYSSETFHPYICLICKHLMHRLAGRLAEEKEALGIITGDNLAQVASQTLPNLFAYRKGLFCPVYSPLIGFEKEDIVKLARKIGTYEISIAPAADGCIPPRRPKTAVSARRLREILQAAGL